jgi:peroxiredoxin
MTDADLARALEALNTRLAAEADAADWVEAVRLPLWDFARGLQTRQLTDSQEARVAARLDALGRGHPGGAEAVQGARRMVLSLAIGKQAPEIAGRDLDGESFRLTDYRGRIVVLMFSGDWCGICRSDYPYTRRLADRFRDAPVVLLGVDSSSTVEAAKNAQEAHGLTYRSWWDGSGARQGRGPIATAWNVVGWPTVYVLDTAGRIRFVDVRRDALVDAVSQLLAPPGR